jgi:hypothetical protein
MEAIIVKDIMGGSGCHADFVQGLADDCAAIEPEFGSDS